MTAFNNDHVAKIQPSVGYRIDYKGKSAVLSGDTHKSQTVIDQSKGVDLLGLEVAAVRPELLKNYRI